MKRFRITWLVSVALLSASLTWAAGQAEAKAPETEVLRVAVATVQHFGSLDPQQNTANAGAQVLYSIHDTLILRHPYGPPLKFEPGLATSWRWVEPMVMELKLRAGVKFHDGTTMSAEDVAFSLNRVFQKKHPDFAKAYGRFYYNFDRVEIVDSLTVRIHTKRAEPLAEILLSEPNASIVSKAYVERVGYDASKTKPIGAGPYKVVSFTPAQDLVLERFDDYWGEKAPLKRIHFTVVPEITSRITALVNKEIDFIMQIPPDQEKMLEGRPGIKVLGHVWPMFHLYALNMNQPPTNNLKIRQAMKLAVDREKLVQGLWGGKAKAPKAYYFPDTFGDKPGLEPIKYDPERARQLVKESGYDGKPVLLTFLPEYYTYGDLAAQAIAEMWEKVGIRVELRAVESFSNDYTGINIRPWSNPMYFPDPMAALISHWSNTSWVVRDKIFNPTQKRNALFDKVRYSTDENERWEAYREILTIAEQDVAPWLLLYQPYELFAMRSDIEWKVPNMYRPYLLSFRAGQIGFKK